MKPAPRRPYATLRDSCTIFVTCGFCMTVFRCPSISGPCLDAQTRQLQRWALIKSAGNDRRWSSSYKGLTTIYSGSMSSYLELTNPRELPSPTSPGTSTNPSDRTISRGAEAQYCSTTWSHTRLSRLPKTEPQRQTHSQTTCTSVKEDKHSRQSHGTSQSSPLGTQHRQPPH